MAGTGNKMQAVIFDMDGVLVQTEHLSWKAWNAVLIAHGKSMSEELFKSLIGTGNSAEVIQKHTRLNVSADDLQRDHQQRVMKLIDDEIEITAGITRLLADIQQRRLQLAVASNSTASFVMRVLKTTALDGFFEHVVTRDQVTRGKPEPDVYLEAAQRMGIAAENCLAIEDSTVGLQAALSAGMRGIALPNPALSGYDFSAAHQRYNSVTELHSALDLLLS